MHLSTTLSLALTPADERRIGEVGRIRFAKLLVRMQTALPILPEKPEETPAASLRALWHLAGGRQLSIEAACDEVLPPLKAAQWLDLDTWIARRIRGEPLAYLTRRQRFMGLDFLVGPQAQIPRQGTELLGRAAIGKLHNLAEQKSVIAIDVGTGCGNLALSMAHFEARAKVFASDISLDAVALAQRNVFIRGLQGRIQIRAGDMFEPFKAARNLGLIDLIVCNPPYISSGKVNSLPPEILAYEPRQAWDGGPFGVTILHRLIRESPHYLRLGGWLAFEVGRGQGLAILQWLKRTGHYHDYETVEDQEGQIRAILARLVTKVSAH